MSRITRASFTGLLISVLFLNLKKIGTVRMTLMVVRSRNHCCSGRAAMPSKCIVEIRVTANKGKI
jgi:hypothetical protein